MKPVRTVSSYVLLVGVMGLSIVGGVLAYQIYSASVKSQTTTEQKEAIKTIDGQIDPQIIENLKKRVVYSENQIDSFVNITPTPTAAPTATEASSLPPEIINPTPEATNSAINTTNNL